MKNEEIIFAGFGGQGILSMGKFLAYSGMDEGLNVSWLPSYGPEMRGGTANCSVILTKDSIGSPIVTQATALIAMNRPSLDKFEKMVVPCGNIITDSSLLNRDVERSDVNSISIPATEIADGIGNKKVANMVLLGALVAKTGIVSMDSILKVLKDHGKDTFYNINKEALRMGSKYVV